MKNFLENIEKQIKELEERFQKNADYISQITSNIEKLAADKLNAIKDSNIVNGAIQAYRNVVAEGTKLLEGDGAVANAIEHVEHMASKAANVASDVASSIVDAVTSCVSGDKYKVE